MATDRRRRTRRQAGATALAAIVTLTSARALAGDDPTSSGARSVPPPLSEIADVDASYERSVLRTRNAPGVLVQVSAGSPGGGVGVSVHGINAGCSEVRPLTLELAQCGAVTFAFVYDDSYRRLRDSAADLAAALRPHLQARPGEPLRVRAHSMGSRVALVALERIGREGVLDGRAVDVALVAPPLGGYKSADFARITPWPLSRIRSVRPAIDMGRGSRFQRRLQTLSLPENVRVRVFLATNDRTVDAGDRRLWQVVARVRGEPVWLPGATHESAVAVAADWLREERARAAEQERGLPLARRLAEARR